ncbi:MAG: DUF2066 domain-containing protein [Gammaproteobacteria bacterium]
MKLIPIIAARFCALLCGAWLFAPSAVAVTFEGLYEAEVPVESQAAELRPEALQRALVTVLVRVTGRREVAADPAVASLLDTTEQFVQQFGYTVDDTLRVVFDGTALRDALLDAGQPVWGSERPATLLWLAIDSGSGQRTLIGADSASDVTELLESVATQRGIPLVLPLLDSEDLARVSFSDVWGGFDEAILAASERYGADAVLVGRAGRSVDGRLLVRWILHFRDQREEWRSTLDDGIQHAADRFARVFAPAGDRLLRAVRIDVSGIDGLRAYGAVSQFLESLTLVQSVGVEEVADDRVVFRVALRGEAETLDRAISLGHILEPVGADNPDQQTRAGADLNYRFRP